MDFRSRDFDCNENAFYFYNNELQPISFVLDWDTKDKFYNNLLNRHIANVLDEPDEYSIVLTKPEKSTYFHSYIPAFDIKFVEYCFTHKDYPDANKYLIKNSCPVTYSEEDMFKCFYLKEKKWTDLHTKTQDKDDDSQSTLYNYAISDVESINSDQESFAPTTSTKISSSKRTRMSYTYKEDAKIVEYIVKHKCAFLVAGKEMWQRMERANVCKIRTWQSMKNRYIKHIKWDLKSGSIKFPFLTPQDLKELRQGLKIDLISSQRKEMLKSRFREVSRIDLISDDGD